MGSHFNVSWFWTKSNIQDVLKLIPSLNKPIVHICSGISNIGDIRIDRSYIDVPLTGKYDINYQGTCNIMGDMCHLPFKDGCAGSIICDPPYDYDFTNDKLISEIIRICKPKGKILFIAPWIPTHKSMTVLNTELWRVGKRPYFKIRTLFYKSNGQIGDYCR